MAATVFSDDCRAGHESPAAAEQRLRWRYRKLPAPGDRHGVVERHTKTRRKPHPGSDFSGRPRLQAEQHDDCERGKQGNQGDDRQPREPIPCRYRTRSDLPTIPLDQTSS